MLNPRKRIQILGALLACGVFSGAWTGTSQKADPQAFTGSWRLNTAGSTNPNGPPPPARGSGSNNRGGSAAGGASTGASGAGGSGDPGTAGSEAGGGGGTRSGGGAAGGSLGSEERARFYAMLKVLEQAPSMLAIAATDKDVTLTLDGSKPFHHVTDGKKEDLPTGNKSFGSLEVKTKWDGSSLKREIKTVDGLTVIETYVPSPDGKQLTVALDLKSQVERLPDAQRQPIKRTYDRVQ
jgi:hypothetical protein